jgi:hypothetical protein
MDAMMAEVERKLGLVAPLRGAYCCGVVVEGAQLRGERGSDTSADVNRNSPASTPAEACALAADRLEAAYLEIMSTCMSAKVRSQQPHLATLPSSFQKKK